MPTLLDGTHNLAPEVLRYTAAIQPAMAGRVRIAPADAEFGGTGTMPDLTIRCRQVVAPWGVGDRRVCRQDGKIVAIIAPDAMPYDVGRVIDATRMVGASEAGRPDKPVPGASAP